MPIVEMLHELSHVERTAQGARRPSQSPASVRLLGDGCCVAIEITRLQLDFTESEESELLADEKVGIPPTVFAL